MRTFHTYAAIFYTQNLAFHYEFDDEKHVWNVRVILYSTYLFCTLVASNIHFITVCI